MQPTSNHPAGVIILANNTDVEVSFLAVGCQPSSGSLFPKQPLPLKCGQGAGEIIFGGDADTDLPLCAYNVLAGNTVALTLDYTPATTLTLTNATPQAVNPNDVSFTATGYMPPSGQLAGASPAGAGPNPASTVTLQGQPGPPFTIGGNGQTTGQLTVQQPQAGAYTFAVTVEPTPTSN